LIVETEIGTVIGIVLAVATIVGHLVKDA